MDSACAAVHQGSLSIKKAAATFKVPYSSLRRQVMKERGIITASIPLAKNMESPKNSEAAARHNVEAACEAVRSKTLSIRKAAKQFHLSFSGLCRRLNNPHLKSVGGQTKFSVEEEKELADLLLSYQTMGVPLTKRLLVKVGFAVGKAKGIPGKRHKFSHRWHTQFLLRHPEVAERLTYASDRKKARDWNEDRCREWISHLDKQSRNGELSNPAAIWHLNECVFHLADLYDQIRAAKGGRQVDAHFDGDKKETLTLLSCGNAAGLLLPPLILYNGEINSSSETNDQDFLVANTSGHAGNELFTAHFRDEVIPKMTALKNFIFVDVHSSHLHNWEFLQLCLNSGKNIKLICFPAGQVLSGHLQPLDTCVVGGVDVQWRQHLSDQHTSLFYEPLSRGNFPAHLMALWPTFNLAATLKDGFKKSGIFPFCKNIIEAALKPISRPSVVAVPSYSSQRRKLREVLVEMNLSKADISSIINVAVRKARGTV